MAGMRDGQNDMFGGGGTFRPLAYPAAPGTGPDDQTCGSCKHCWSTRSGSGGPKRYYKCGLMSMSRSANTDIALRSEACSYWERDDRLEVKT